MITLLVMVDYEEKSFKVQRTLLMFASNWFEEALDRLSEEGQPVVLRFPDTDPQVLEHFVYFLMRGRILNYDSDWDEPIDETLAVRIWVFADKHGLVKLQNQAMELLHDRFDLHDDIFPEPETLCEALETSAPKSAMRKFMLAMMITGLQFWKACGGNELDGRTYLGYSPTEVQTVANANGVMIELAERIAQGITSDQDVNLLQTYLVDEDD